MRSEVHAIESGGRVPFSWENTPGVSKTRNDNRDYGDRDPSSSPTVRSLPPPPSPLESKRKPKLLEMQIPLPPCTFPAPPPRKDGRCRGSPNPKKGEKNKKKEEDGEDPFFVAYEVCTEVSRSTRRHDAVSGSGAGRLRGRLLMGLSCKTSDACRVMEGNLTRIPRSS
ncbi:hypothetical protein MLD38_001720 [Melastoma candidum]|uniref:Uncharacterized protein n=1 Tax=Melastoma candidum TaxID=119954 RepID=A0ACB9SEK0_9MYRT|nr:hypothetical protein MLD38_001720 [Melastoma candidum]